MSNDDEDKKKRIKHATVLYLHSKTPDEKKHNPNYLIRYREPGNEKTLQFVNRIGMKYQVAKINGVHYVVHNRKADRKILKHRIYSPKLKKFLNINDYMLTLQ